MTAFRVNGATALAWRRGRYVSIPTFKGPRPSPLALGRTAALSSDFMGEPDFRCMARLHVFEEAFIVVGGGDDGAVITDGRESVIELCAFTQLGQKPRPLDLHMEVQPDTLENIIVGFDGSFSNYYHWLVNALGRSWLCSNLAPDATIVIPDFHKVRNPGQMSAGVMQASLDAVLATRKHRLVGPGIHRVRDLHVLWTRPTSPTDVTGLKPLYQLFDDVKHRLARTTADRRRRLYFSRAGVHNRRLPASDAAALDKLLSRHSFEVLQLEKLSFQEQVNAAAAAQVIVAPHGAALTNLVFSDTEAIVIELVSRIDAETTFRPWFYHLAASRGQRYGAIKVGEPGWLNDLNTTLTRCLR